MERPQQQITNAIGRIQMREIFESRGWAVREIPQDTDIGVDFEVEVFENYKSTGTLFKVQLKSSARSDYSTKGDTVREHVKRKHLTYYCKELTDPLILIHADVKTKKTFWLAPQLTPCPESWLDGSEPERRASLLMPTANEVPGTMDDLIRAVAQLKLIIGTRTVLGAPLPQFLRDIKEQVDENQVIADFRDKSDALKLGQIQQLYRARRFEEALDRIYKILNDTDCSVHNRFWAILEKERIDHRMSAESGRVPQAALPEVHLRHAKELQRLTEKGPPELKFFALISVKAAELDQLTHKAVGLAMNYRTLVANNSGYWALHAYGERLALEQKIWKKFDQCIRLARYAASSQHRYALPSALTRIPQGISMYLVSLETDQRHDLAKKLADSAFQVCELAAWIAGRTGDNDSIVLAASSAVLLSRSGTEAYVDWANKTVRAIGESAIRSEGIALVDRQLRRTRGEKLPGDLWGKPTSEQVYENMANGIGINMSDPNDPLTKLVRIGLADSNPTRVFTTCRSIFVSLGPMRDVEMYVLERLGLPVGPKALHCEKFGYGMIGTTLDEAYAAFNAEHCSMCQAREDRPRGWRYSHEWHNKEGERLANLLSDFRVRPASTGKDKTGPQ